MTKTKLVSIITACVVMLPLVALAYTSPTPPPGNQSVNIRELVNNVMDVVWIVFAAIVIILFIYAGVRFLTAGGQPEKIQEARTAAIWGVVGVVVVVLAYSIFAIAQSIITGAV